MSTLRTVHFADGTTLKVKSWMISDKKQYHFRYVTESGKVGEVGFWKVDRVENL